VKSVEHFGLLRLSLSQFYLQRSYISKELTSNQNAQQIKQLKRDRSRDYVNPDLEILESRDQPRDSRGRMLFDQR
jgi:hypothetical protein